MKTELHPLKAKLYACPKLIRLLVLIALCGRLPGFVPNDRAAWPPEPPPVSLAGPALEELATPAAEHGSPEQRSAPRAEPGRGIYKAQIKPHWFLNNTRFWYRNDLPRGTKEFILVDVERGTRQPAFDHDKLAATLAKAGGGEYPATQLPFSDLEFVEAGKAIRFEAARRTWQCDLSAYECLPLPSEAEAKPSAGGEPAPTAAPAPPPRDAARPAPFDGPPSPAPAAAPEQKREARQGQRSTGNEGPGEAERTRQWSSPDGKWTAFIRDHNVCVRSEADGAESPLSQDGREGDAYGRLEWAPDSRALVSWRTEPGERKEVHLMQWAPPGGGRAALKSRPYALPGDRFTRYELNLFHLANHTQIKPQVERFEHEWEAPRIHWSRDGRHFAFDTEDRGHQRFRILEVDALTGVARTLVDERTETFIWTAHTENLSLKLVNWLEKTDEMVYVSERTGWRHLYLIDTREGKIKNPITAGEYVVRGIDRIDEETRQIWFHASGKNPGQDPYFIHYYRVGFDGAGLVALTAGDGHHTLQYAPDRKYLIDTYSRVDKAPVHELRRVADGALGCPLEEADIAELRESGWTPPEVFTAKGRDGVTDIWGIICRPARFNPNGKYPVIEQIYAGPQSSYTPKSFSSSRRFAALTDLGFIVVQLDGMGTANRSKAFHDVCWKNLKDGGFPDRILWLKAAAAKYPALDLTRVGVYGTSAGGQNAAGALLFHPDFYKAAVANCGCHDNRMDKASWNEQWMGYPVGPQYAESSNIEHAANLQGHLFLIVGGMDDNVPPESTFRFVDALIRANKDFDLLVVPAGGHGSGGAYAQRRLQDFFQRHLLGTEPPPRNSTKTP